LTNFVIASSITKIPMGRDAAMQIDWGMIAVGIISVELLWWIGIGTLFMRWLHNEEGEGGRK